MPFGLCNTPATFQRMMHDLLRQLIGNGVVNFMDDIMIHTKGNLETHVRKVSEVLEILQENQLAVEIAKCEFHKEEVEFLGYIVDGMGVRMSEARSKAVTVQEWKAPKSQKEVQIFIRFCNFYRRFIQ